jgi:hypothetical protein
MKPVIPPPRGISPSTFLRQAINLLSERAARRSKKWRSPRELRHSCSSTITYGLKVVRVATASERPSVGPGRARGDEPARILLWHPGQYEVPTNDEPRHQPTRPETRPNQRLYVSLGSPPSVAVGSSSARAAHRSRAPHIDIPRMTSIAVRVKISRSQARQARPVTTYPDPSPPCAIPPRVATMSLAFEAA